MKLRRSFCLLLALLLFTCGVYSALPCGHVAAAEIGDFSSYPGAEDLYNYALENFVTEDKPYLSIFRNSADQYVTISSSLPFIATNLNNNAYFISSGTLTYRFSYVSTPLNITRTISESAPTSVGYPCVVCNYVLLYNDDVIYDPNPYVCPNTDANCDNICDECGELLPMEYWSTELEYMVTTGYGLISKNIFDYNPHFFCVIYNSEYSTLELITSRTAFEINSFGDVLLCEDPVLYRLSVNEDGSFTHYRDTDVSSTSDGIYIDPNKHDPLRFLYSNFTIQRPEYGTFGFVFALEYDPFGGGETVGGGMGREQVTRFDIDLDTYEPIGGLPADPEYGSGRVDVVVSPTAPPLSVPVSPTTTVTPTPDPVPVVTPTPDPSDPNSIIIQNQITNIGNDLAALPDKVGEKITDKIGDSIKGLFVPSETDIVAVKEKWTMLFSERFGAVYESTTLIDGVFDAFVFDAVQPTFTFPTIELEFSGVPFVLGGWEVRLIPEGFDFIVPIIKSITNISLTLVFLNAMRKKYERLVHH